MTDSVSTPQRRGPKRTLSSERVVAAALDLVDRGGVQALSVRGVAAALGVRPNAIYTYLPDRAALERALVDAVLAEVEPGLLDGAPRSWRARVRRFATELRATLHGHPGVATLLLSAPMDGPAALVVGERLLLALGDAGLSRRDAARAAWVLIVYVVGSVALDVADVERPHPFPAEEQRVAARRERLAAVPFAGFPATAAVVGEMASWVTEEQFAWGLDRILKGLGKD